VFTDIVSGGSGSLSYQWYLDGSAVSGATSVSFSYAASGTSHSVTCTVTDSASVPVTSPASNSVSVTVNSALAAPICSTSQAMVDQGQTSSLTFTAESTGTSPFSYQWFAEAPDASFYSSISGATSSIYSFATTVSTNTGAWSFELQVTDSVGAQVISSPTSVTVNMDPSVTVSPETAILDVRQSQLFTADPSGGSGTYTSYQWYVDNVAQSEQTGSTFSYSSGSAGSYSVTVTVTDSLGATSTQSVAATVTASATVTPASTPTTLTVTPTPTTSPSPSLTPTPNNTLSPSQNPTTSPNQNYSQSLPKETIYGITAAVTIVAIVTVVLVLKNNKKGKS